MTIKYERLYGVPATANFVLWEFDGVNVSVTASCVLGDCVIYLDEAASANTTNLFSARAADVSGFGHRIVLTAAEMTGRRVVVAVRDHHSIKEYLDEVLIFETYGNELSLHNRRDPGVILATDISSVTSQTVFVVTDKPNDNNTLLNTVCMIIDNSSPNSPPDRSFRNVTAYTGSTGTVTIATSSDFTIAANDQVFFFPSADVESADTIASAVWDKARTDHTTAGTFGEGVSVESLTATASAQVSANTQLVLSQFEALSTDSLPTNFVGMTIGVDGGVTVSANADKSGYSLSVSAYTSAADVLLTRSFSDVSADTGRSLMNAARFLRNKWSIDGTVLTVTQEDDSTTAWISNLTTAASANTVTESDPTT